MISRYVRAGFPILGIRSFEPSVLRQQIAQDLQGLQNEMGGAPFLLWNWDCMDGLHCLTDPSHKAPGDDESRCRDPLDLLDFVPTAPQGSIFLLNNFHHTMKKLPVIQKIQNLVPAFKNRLCALIVVAPDFDIPVELERLVTILDHDLPKRERLLELTQKYISEYSDDFDVPVTDETLRRAVEAGLGQTIFEYENGLALCITEKKTIDPSTIWEMKAQIVKKNGNVELGNFSETLDSLKGLENLKEFGRQVIPSPLSRGILLLGVPGCGKCLAKGTPVMMHNQEIRPVETIVAGDRLMGPDTKPRVVLGTTSGFGPMFRVTPQDGLPYEVNGAHVLSLKEVGTFRTVNVEIGEYLRMVEEDPSKKDTLLGWRSYVKVKGYAGKTHVMTPISVEPIGDGEYYGFESSGDHLFLLGDFTVTHNSHFSKALGNELGLPTLCIDFGRMFGHLMGQSEAQARAIIRVIEAMAPCIPFIDEIEKGLAGVKSSGQTDSGVAARVIGTFLTWMNDHTTHTPVIATSNNIDSLPPEFLRAERWDAIFFIDLPTEEEGHSILSYHLGAYEFTEKSSDLFKMFDLKGYTGAELKSMCRLGRIWNGDIEKAYRYIVPIYKSRESEIRNLRRRAESIAVPATIRVDPDTKDQPDVRVFSSSPRKLHTDKKGSTKGIRSTKKPEPRKEKM